jgi:hypothetical protein
MKKNPNLNNIVGFVDAMDIAAEFASRIVPKVDIRVKNFSPQDRHIVLDEAHKIVQEKCANVLNISERDPLVFIEKDRPLIDAVRMLSLITELL